MTASAGGASRASARPRSRRGEGERLRDEILDAAERLVVRSGDADAVSIRAIADAVGVTPPSIYLHFRDKESLIVAVCERRFEEFDAAIEAAGATTDDPIESLRRRGRAYVQFGIEHPAAYRVLFMTTRTGPERFDPLADTGGRAFQHLIDAVQRAMDAGAIAARDPLLAATGIWVGVHGLTSLMISLPDNPWPDFEVLLDHVCDVQISGLRQGGDRSEQSKRRELAEERAPARWVSRRAARDDQKRRE